MEKVQFTRLFYYGSCFCVSSRNLFETKVTRNFSYVFFQKFYSLSSQGQEYDQFLVNLFLVKQFKIRVEFIFFPYGCPAVLKPLVEMTVLSHCTLTPVSNINVWVLFLVPLVCSIDLCHSLGNTIWSCFPDFKQLYFIFSLFLRSSWAFHILHLHFPSLRKFT